MCSSDHGKGLFVHVTWYRVFFVHCEGSVCACVSYWVNIRPSIYSPDGTACVWDTESALMLVKYVGHGGSVNSLSFHPHEMLACSVSGDTSVHIWRYHVTIPSWQRCYSNPAERLVRVCHGV